MSEIWSNLVETICLWILSGAITLLFSIFIQNIFHLNIIVQKPHLLRYSAPRFEREGTNPPGSFKTLSTLSLIYPI